MKDETSEFSFILKSSEHSVGVFVTHDIKNGTYLDLFPGQAAGVNPNRVLKKSDVPHVFWGFCIERAKGEMMCPQNFNALPIGWYLNHSALHANATHKNPDDKDYLWYASRDIFAGEEILIDYNTLGEPESAKEEYYKK